jgi:Cdc6-like AAA superfamily ATPase
VASERPKCLESLNKFDCETYRDQLSKRHETSCSWLFSDVVYRSWLENENCPIFCAYGGPGFGKTVLSSVFTKEILKETNISFGHDHSVAYFFDDKDERLRTSHALLSNLLAQLLRQDPKALVHFIQEEDCQLNLEKTGWNSGMLWRVFIRNLKDDKIKPVFLIIDVLGMFGQLYYFPGKVSIINGSNNI